MTVLSEATATRAVRASTRRGWAVVAGAFAMMFVTFGAAYSFSAFFASLQQTFAASRGDIAFSFSIAVPLYYLIGAISGPLADRFGARMTCLFGVAIAGAGLIFAASATALWQVHVGFGWAWGLESDSPSSRRLPPYNAGICAAAALHPALPYPGSDSAPW